MMTGYLAARGTRVAEQRVQAALRAVNLPYHRERREVYSSVDMDALYTVVCCKFINNLLCFHPFSYTDILCLCLYATQIRFI